MQFFRKITLIGVMSLVNVLAFSGFSPSLQAQTNNGNLEDLPNNSQQATSWACAKGSNRVEVEAKDVNHWQELMQGQGWQCDQQIDPIALGDLRLTCEPYNVIGILSIAWIKGEQGQQQLQTWKDQLGQKPGMICTLKKVRPWGALEDI